MALTAAEVYRNYATDGVPSSGAHDPKKEEIRTLLGQYEQIINAFTSNGGLIYSSKAAMDADLAHAANSMAWVVGDATAGNNGVYRKQGASGAGSWTRIADLPYSFIVASDVGAGTPNGIVATSSLPVSGSALVLLNVYETNTGSPVTVSFNGGTPLTIKTNSGNDVAPGGLVEGMLVLGRVSGSTFRLVSDQASAAIQVAAEAAQAASELARDQAEAAASSVEPTTYPTIAAAQALSLVSAPSFIQTAFYDSNFLAGSGARYRKVAAEPSHAGKFSITLSDGSTVVWYEIAEAVLTPPMFGAFGTGDDTDALLGLWSAYKAIPSLTLDGCGRTYRCDKPLIYDAPGRPNLRNIVFDFRQMVAGEGQFQVAFVGTGVGTPVPLASNTEFPASTVSLSSAASFSANDVIFLVSDEQWCSRADEDVTNNEFAIIRSISGNVLTLNGTVHGRYATAQNARVYKFDTSLSPIVENVEVIGASGSVDRIGICFRQCYRPYGRNIRATQAFTSGVWLIDCVFSDFDATLVRRASSTGIGNGLVCSGGRWNRLGDVTGEDTRHVVSVGQVSSYGLPVAGRIARDTTVGRTIGIGCRDGVIDTHAGASDVRFGDVVADFYEIDDSVFGVSLNGFNCSVGDVNIKGGFNRAVSFQYRGGGDLNRKNNMSCGRITMDGRMDGTVASYALVVQCAPESSSKKIDSFSCDGVFGDTRSGVWIHALSGDIDEVSIGPSKWRSTNFHGLYVQATASYRCYFLKLDMPSITAPTDNTNYNALHLDGQPYYAANANAKAMIRAWVTGGQLIGGNFGVRARASDVDLIGTRLTGSTSTATSAGDGSAIRQTTMA